MMFLKAVLAVIPVIVSVFVVLSGALIIEECRDNGKPDSVLGRILEVAGIVGVVVTPILAVLWLRP
jgi:hypothetical protein